MRSNWNSTQDRFKSLQAVARITRDEKTALVAEVAELMTKIEKAASENDGVGTFLCSICEGPHIV